MKMQRSRQRVYDAIVVGSGATGGWAAKVLTEQGLRVVVLEAGRAIDPARDYRMMTQPYELRYRGVAPGAIYAPAPADPVEMLRAATSTAATSSSMTSTIRTRHQRTSHSGGFAGGRLAGDR
jgi:choline dehydrogenase-like flavoprotein